jgi:ABC-type branched-subunit amino acid transport system permease subunit
VTEWTRWFSEPRRLGRVVLVVAAAFLLVYPVVSDDAYYQNMIILSLVFAVGASGLNIMMGYAG